MLLDFDLGSHKNEVCQNLKKDVQCLFINLRKVMCKQIIKFLRLYDGNFGESKTCFN